MINYLSRTNTQQKRNLKSMLFNTQMKYSVQNQFTLI